MNDEHKEKIEEIKNIVYEYFSRECDVEKEKLSDETDIMKDLEGDSLMLLGLLELVRKKYGINVELKTLGKHLMKKPANTIGQIIDLTQKLVAHGDAILNVDI